MNDKPKQHTTTTLFQRSTKEYEENRNSKKRDKKNALHDRTVRQIEWKMEYIAD